MCIFTCIDSLCVHVCVCVCLQVFWLVWRSFTPACCSVVLPSSNMLRDREQSVDCSTLFLWRMCWSLSAVVSHKVLYIPLSRVLLPILMYTLCMHTGSHVEKLGCLIHKLLPHASGLLYTQSASPSLPPSSSTAPHRLPKITGVVSHLGERLEIEQVCYT